MKIAVIIFTHKISAIMVNTVLGSSTPSAHSRKGATRQSSDPRGLKKNPSEENTQNVSGGIFQKMGNAFVASKAMAFAVNVVSNQYINSDKEFLTQLTGSEDISVAIKKIAPQLPLAIQKFLPDAMARFANKQQESAEKVIEALIIHVIANLAVQLYPDQSVQFKAKQPISKKITLEKLTHDVTTHVLYLLADEFNNIDKDIHNENDITPDRFIALSNKMIALALPATNTGVVGFGDRLLAKYLSNELPTRLMQVYKPFGIWLTGGEVKIDEVKLGDSDLNELIPILEKFGAFIANCMAESHLEKDKALLKRLTGVEDAQKLVEHLAPQVIEGLLESEKVRDFLETLSFDPLGIIDRNGETISNVSTSLILKVIANIAREVFAEEKAKNITIPMDEFVERFAMGVSDIVGTHIREIKQANNPTQKNYQPMAEHLLRIVLPKDRIVRSFLDRRKDRLTESLSGILKKYYESIVPSSDIIEESKQQLREILWVRSEQQSKNPLSEDLPEIPTKKLSKEFGVEKVVDQLFNVCHNLTNLCRTFIAKELSDADVIEDQMHSTLAGFAIPEGLLTGVAGGLCKLISKGHKVSDPQVIIRCLQKFKEEGVEDDLIAAIAVHVDSLSGAPISSQSPKKSNNGNAKILAEENKQTGTIVLSDSKVLVKYLNSLEQFAGLEPKQKKRIADEILTALYADNPIYWITPTIQNALQLTLFKGLVHLLEKVPPEKRNRDELFSTALQIILDVSASELPIIVEGIKKLGDPSDTEFYIEDEEERSWTIQKLIAPYSDKIIQTFYEDEDENGAKLEDHLPLPDQIKPFVGGLIRENAPKLILPIIEAFTSWIDAKKENRERLNDVFGNQHASEACRMMGALTKQALPYCLQEYHETIADGISKNFAYMFANQNGKEPSEKDLKVLRQMVDKTLENLSQNTSSSMKALLGFLQDFSESAFLRCFADLAECLDDLDKEHRDDEEGSLLVQGATSFLAEMQMHLSLIADLKSDIHQYKAGNVPHDDLVQKFTEEGHLHPAMRKQAKKEQFFVDLSKKFFRLVGVSKEVTLPIPQFLKSSLWDAFENDLMPIILLTIFEHARDPHTLNLILISLFQQINAESDNVDVAKPDIDIKKYNDAPQDEIEDVCADLIQALVSMQPSAVTKWLLKNDKVKELAGQTIGQPIRDAINEKTIISILDKLIVSLLPSLHPGEWVEETGKFRCLKGTGKNQKPTKPKFDHLFPRDDKAKKTCAKIRASEVKKAERQVVKEITHTIENQTKYIFLGFLRKAWEGLRKYIHLLIDKTSGKHSKSIKKIADRILDGLAKYFIKPTLFIITYPVLIVVGKLLRFYFVHQSKRRAQDVKHPVNENVFFRLIDRLFELVEKAQNSQESGDDDDEQPSKSFVVA